MEIPGKVALLENTPTGLASTEGPASRRVAGARIGATVMNANPFTYGHARPAHACATGRTQFVVGENSSLVSYEDRYAAARRAGGLRTTLHRLPLHDRRPLPATS